MQEPLIAQVSPLEDYRLLLVYENGERRSFDVRPYIRGDWYGKLGDEAYFRAVAIVHGGWCVAWPQGQDIAPDDLYRNSVPVA